MFLLMAAAVAAAVSTPTPSPSASPVPEIAHVVTSDRSSESAAHAARTTYVVTAADIARNGDRTIADAIENIPGVNVERYGAFGSLTSVGIRGSSQQQVLVLLDGLPIAGAQIGNVNVEQMPVSGVDRIEVVEGGGSTLYGSGSIGGVINIITRRQTQSTATLSTGSFGEQTYLFQTPYVSFQRTYAANDYPLPGGATRENANAGLTSATATYAHTFGAVDVSLEGDLSSAGVRVPNSVDFFSPTGWQSTVANDLRARFEKRGPRSALSLSLGESQQNLFYSCDTPIDSTCPNTPYYPPPAGSPSPPPYAQLLDDSRVMASLSNAVGDDRQRLVYGVDLSRGNARIDGGTGDPAFTSHAYSQTAAYVQQQWFARNGNMLYAGLRGENDLIAASDASGHALSPSLGGILHLASDVEMKLNAATAFRAPTAEDLFYPYFSNPNLVPERTRVGDVTIEDSAILGGASVGWFTTSGSNLIVDNASFIPQNIGRASIQGLTLGVKSRARRGYSASLDVTDLYRAQDLDDQTRIAGRGPVLALRAGVRYSAPAYSRFDGFGVGLTAAGGQGAFDASLPYYAQSNAGYSTLGGYVGYRIAPRMILTLRGFNLLDDRYAVVSGYPMPGRSFALELRSR